MADVYDALTSDRPYRRGLSRAAALRQIEEWAGRLLDARVTAVLLDLVADGCADAGV